VAKSGFWVPNANDDGLVLMGTYKVPGTDVPVKIKIKRADGGLVEIKFNQMDAMRNAQRAARANEPLIPQGVTDAAQAVTGARETVLGPVVRGLQRAWEGGGLKRRQQERDDRRPMPPRPPGVDE